MKKASVFLLILTVTMVFVMPAKSYADPQLDILLNIATHARDSLSITISQISNVPAQISQVYTQGSNETDALAQAVSNQDTDSAKQHFLAAMKYFKQTNDMINSLNATATNDPTKAETRQLQGEIIRLENMGNLLKSIAQQNNVDVNFTSFDQMLQTANQDINSGNLSDASAQIQSANEFIVNTHNSITAAAQEQISQRAREFTERQIAQLNVTQSSTVQQNNNGNVNTTINTQPHSTVTQNTTNNQPPTTPPVNDSSVPMTNNPKDMVAELKTLVAQGKVDQAINLIKIIQAYQKAKLAEKASEAITPTPQPAPANNTLPTPPTPPANNTQPTTNPTPPTPQSSPANNTPPTPPTTNPTPPTPQPTPANTTQPAANNTQPIPPQSNSNQTNEQESKNNEHHEKRHHATLTPQSQPANTTLPTPPPANTTLPPTNTTLPAPPTLPPTNPTPSTPQSAPSNTTLPTPPTPQPTPILPSTNTTQSSPQPHPDQSNDQEHKSSDHEKRHGNSNHEKRKRHHEE